jgi:hypothetical protein
VSPQQSLAVTGAVNVPVAAFEDKPWAGLLAAFGGTVVISALIEAARRIGSGWRK